MTTKDEMQNRSFEVHLGEDVFIAKPLDQRDCPGCGARLRLGIWWSATGWVGFAWCQQGKRGHWRNISHWESNLLDDGPCPLPEWATTGDLGPLEEMS